MIADKSLNASAPIIIATMMRPHGETGLQTHFQTIKKYWERNGRSVCLVTPFSGSPLTSRVVFAWRRLIDPLNGELGTWWYFRWHRSFLESALSKVLPEDPVTIYVQCVPSASAALNTRRNPEQKVVLVVHFNGSHAEEWHGKGKIKRGSKAYQYLQALDEETLPRLDGIIYVSEYMKRQLETRMPEVVRLPSAVIPNFLPAMCAANPKITGDLITVGTLEPRKNQAYLLEVVAAAKSLGYRYSLTVVGEGGDMRALVRRAADLGIAEQVNFLGYKADAARFIGTHRAYVHSALMENLPYVLIEAMASGKPVFAPAVGGISEIFRDGIEGCHWPLDSSERCARLLIEALEDQDLYSRMSVAALRRFEANYSEQTCAARITAFLRELSSSNSERAVAFAHS